MQDGLGKQRREIAGAESSGRDSGDISLSLTDALSFVVAEEEEFVLAIEEMRDYYRAAQVGAKLIQVKRRDRISAGIEIVFSVEIRVTKEFIQSAMILVGAGTERDVDDGRPAAIGCWRGTGLHFEFLNGIDRRIKDENVGVRIDALNSVKQIDSDIGGIAVNNRTTGSPACMYSRRSRRWWSCRGCSRRGLIGLTA